MRVRGEDRKRQGERGREGEREYACVWRGLWRQKSISGRSAGRRFRMQCVSARTGLTLQYRVEEDWSGCRDLDRSVGRDYCTCKTTTINSATRYVSTVISRRHASPAAAAAANDDDDDGDESAELDDNQPR